MATRKPPQSHTTPEDKAYRTALARLNRAAMSRSRLDAKLAAAGYDDVTRAAALDRLERAGLLNDEAYARALIDEFRRSGAGPAMLRQKLAQRGVSSSLIDQLLAEVDQPGDTLDAARTFALQKLRTMQRLDPATQRRRLWGVLARRGYDADTVERVVGDIVGNDDAADAF